MPLLPCENATSGNGPSADTGAPPPDAAVWVDLVSPTLQEDKLVETMGADPVENYDKKVSCCGGALAFSEPEKSQALIKDIIESAYDGGADMIVTPCPVCQMNVEVYQNHINQKYKTNFKMPVVYYSTLMSVAYGKNGKEAGLDGQVIKAKQLEEIASK